MPDIHSGIKMGRKRLPKVINPKLHAVLDYASVAACLGMGALYWNRHRPAAITCFALGAIKTANNLLTDYPGGVWGRMSLETHDRVSSGIAAMSATVPRAVGFADDHESRFFRLQALAEAAVVSMAQTDLNENLHAGRYRDESSQSWADAA